jgi:hypothetical protein
MDNQLRSPGAQTEIPFPNTAAVDARLLPLNHMNILEIDDVYEYIIDLFDSRIESGSDQAAAASVQIDSSDAQSSCPPSPAR